MVEIFCDVCSGISWRNESLRLGEYPKRLPWFVRCIDERSNDPGYGRGGLGGRDGRIGEG